MTKTSLEIMINEKNYIVIINLLLLINCMN